MGRAGTSPVSLELGRQGGAWSERGLEALLEQGTQSPTATRRVLVLTLKAIRSHRTDLRGRAPCSWAREKITRVDLLMNASRSCVRPLDGQRREGHGAYSATALHGSPCRPGARGRAARVSATPPAPASVTLRKTPSVGKTGPVFFESVERGPGSLTGDHGQYPQREVACMTC